MLHYRALPLETPNDATKTVEASLSSETAVFRPGDGYEVLRHTPDAIDLSRAPLPLLTSHDRQETPVGIIENIRIAGGKLRGTLRFGASQRALDVWQDVKAGVLRSVSVGYQILETQPRGKDGYTVTRWMPYEASLVSVPADPTVGVGRSFQGIQTMEEIQEQEVHQSRSQRRAAARSEEESRNAFKEINAMQAEFNIDPRKTRDFIDTNGLDIDGYRNLVIRNLKDKGPLRVAEDYEVGLSSREASRFSFTKAILAQIDPHYGARNAGLELEVSRAMAQKVGREPQGIFVPPEVLSQRDLTVGTDAQGGYLRPTEHMGSSFIDILRNASHVLNLGASELRDLTGDVSIPKKTSASTAYWVLEGNAPSESQPGFSNVALSPKTVAGFTDYTRKLLLQGSPAIEGLVRADLAGSIGVEVDRAAINGSGTGAEPLGILNTSGVASVPIGANGGLLTWDHILDLEQALSIGNADSGSLAYLATTKVRRKLKGTLKVPSDAGAGFIWEAGVEPGAGRMNGYGALATNNVPSTLTKGTGTGLSALIFGNWADLYFGYWGGLDILVDPYTLATSGGYRIVALLDVDIALRRIESFAVIKDAVTT